MERTGGGDVSADGTVEDEMSLRIGVMSDTDLGRVGELRGSVGWPADPLAFDLLRGVRDARWAIAEVAGGGGTLAGMVGVVPLGRKGMVFHLAVQEAFRGAGIGRALSSWAVAYLRSQGVATVRLYSTPEAEGLYRGIGFEPVGCRAVYRVEVGEMPKVSAGTAGCSVVPLGFRQVPELCGMDYWTYGGDRSALILATLRLHDGGGWLARDATGRIQGYLIEARSDPTLRLGPLAAADPEVARTLLSTALAGREHATLTVPAPAGGTDACATAMLGDLGFVGGPDRTCLELHSGVQAAGEAATFGAGLTLYGTTPYLAT
jgi:ribosomal protein S18 acetylase RimI-like enzyme